MSNQSSLTSNIISPTQLTFDTPSLPQYRSSIQSHLKEEKLGNMVLNFSKKAAHKRNQRKLHNFSNFTSNSQDLGSNESNGYAKSAEQKYHHGEFSIQQKSITGLKFQKHYSQWNPSKEEIVEQKQKERSLHGHPFRKQISDHSTLARTNKYETRDNSEYHPRKSDHLISLNQQKKSFGSHSGFFKVVNIDQSFQIAGMDEGHYLDTEKTEQKEANIILEQSVINPVCEELKEKLDSFLNSNSERQLSSVSDQIKKVKKSRVRLVKIYISDYEKKQKIIVQDSVTRFVMQQEIYKNYFISKKKKSQIFWYYLLGKHPVLKNLYGIEKNQNDLVLFWEPFPEKPKSLKKQLQDKTLKRSLIPGIIKQILSIICSFRKFDILHGDLLPENFDCILSNNDEYIIKLKTLKSCSRFTAKEGFGSKTKRQLNYYPPTYERNSFLVPDLIALCLITLELYTGIQPTVEEVLCNLEKDNVPPAWSNLPEKAYDFMKSVLALVKNNHESQSLEPILIHGFVWGSTPTSFEL